MNGTKKKIKILHTFFCTAVLGPALFAFDKEFIKILNSYGILIFTH
jgi:hypothetical protein